MITARGMTAVKSRTRIATRHFLVETIDMQMEEEGIGIGVGAREGGGGRRGKWK